MATCAAYVSPELAVADNGSVSATQLSPSVAVGDLNGDGLPDLVLVDPMGFIWYFSHKRDSPRHAIQVYHR